MNGRVPLRQAERSAGEVLETIGPWVKRAEVAGSVRRRRSDVKDLDIVCLPNLWWSDVLVKESLADSGAWFTQVAGSTWAFEWKGLKVELYIAVPERYAMTLLWRTGSAKHNVKLASRAMAQGLRMRAEGVVHAATGEVVAWEEEAEIFEALGMEYLPPERRNGW